MTRTLSISFASFLVHGLVLGLVLGLSAPAHAALDEQLAAKDSTPTVIDGAKLRVRVRGNVKEFADASGKIFAASWRGFAPIATLLGPYREAYRAAMHSRRTRSLHAVEVRTPELEATVIVYGPMAEGHLLLVKRLPKGVHADALR